LQENRDICEFFAFPNIKKQANLRLPLHVQKLKVFQLQGVLPPPLTLWLEALPLDPATSFPCTYQLNKVDIWATPIIKLLPSCALALACLPPASDF